MIECMIDKIQQFCKSTKCADCPLSRNGWLACEFKRNPVNWNVELIKSVIFNQSKSSAKAHHKRT